MPISDSAASNQAAPPDQARNIQTLISLLGDMMPLLLRIQSLMGQASAVAPADLVLNPMIEHQAAVSFVENLAADALQRLSSYLDARTAQTAGIDICRPIVAQAANCLAVHDYAQTFNLIWQAYRLITALRAVDPQLPPLNSAAAGKAAGSPDSGSTHH